MWCQLFSLQKPSKSSKSKEHLEALTRRLSLWNEGGTDGLLYEGQTTQDRLKGPENATNISNIEMFVAFSGPLNLNLNLNKHLNLYQKLFYKVYVDQFTHLKLTLMYLTLPQKYKLDDNHKTNINTFEVFSWIVSWWQQPHTTCGE